MLAVKSERNAGESEMLQGFPMEETEFIGGGDLLDSIDFDDLFAGICDRDLEMDQEILAESPSSESENENAAPDSVSVSDVGLESPGLIPAEDIISKTEGPEPEPKSESKPKSSVKNPASKESERTGKNPPGKKKAKVDWTPELHRRFVTAVEQLGIDKAVPSRILEIMGIDCLTRHNIASHLQKYRSHRKHLQAREAESASWSRRRQIYGTAAAPTVLNPWNAPTMVAPAPHFRPLHVWGHPSVDQSLMYMWPKHVAPRPQAWPLPQPLVEPSFWHLHHQYVPPPGTLCFPPQFPPKRFPPPPASDVSATQPLPKSPSNVHPSKESIDAAIGDVIRKPWLPLPLGLKPPSMDGVMVELQRQGVPATSPKKNEICSENGRPEISSCRSTPLELARIRYREANGRFSITMLPSIGHAPSTIQRVCKIDQQRSRSDKLIM